MKTCKACGNTKDRTEFHRNSLTQDGLFAVCKECHNARSLRNYYENRDRYLAVMRVRIATPEGRKKKCEQIRRYQLNNPEKHRARQLLRNAIRRGVVSRGPCDVCGAPRTEGHHIDYARPLDVRWLCRKHHFAEHGKTI